ncbi:uncharacterized protein toporsb [Brachyhypopomus gauderio]|uniref:uncharacterized protein toporsb n=1 Tax=Brachyhypopomus gauderio TaxID=698409 RepID=UPI004040F214
MMAPTKMKLRVRKREGGAKPSQRLLATEASPDSKCPICLDRFNNVASLDRCLHRFCFRCIHEWSKNKAECPLCKQPFCSIFHSVRAENDFKEFVLAPAENGPPATAPPPPAGQAEDAGGGGEHTGRARRARTARGRERRSRRRSNPAPAAASPPGVGLEGEAGAERERGVRRVVMRLMERRRSRTAQRSLRRLRDQDVVAFRRALYRTGVRVRGSWDGGRPRDVSAAYLRRNPACLHRLLPWLQRELTVLYGSHGSLVSIVQHIIMSRITHHDMDDAVIRDELRPFLLARTDHFLHELVNFARSTLSMEAYDQQAVYESTAPSYEEDSASTSSIISISEDDDDHDSGDTDIAEDPVQDLVPPVSLATGGESSLSQSAWDDETPGPSYSTLFPSPSQSQADGAEPATVLAEEEEEVACGGPGEEECVIVGYVKPMAERTPELVQLSSDSSEEEEKEAVTTETPAATVTKTESSQAQAPPSSQLHLSPCTSQDPSPPPTPHTPPCAASPLHTPRLCSSSEERDATEGDVRPTTRACLRSRARSRSSSDGSVLSERSRSGGRSHKRSGSASRLGEPSTQAELRGRGHRSVGRSPTVSIPSDSSSGSWEVGRCKASSRSPVCWDSPGRPGRRDGERRRWRSRSPPHAPSNHHRDSHRRHGHRERRLRSSSVSSGGVSDPPRPEKPAGKHKYKTRHLERAARRQGGSPGEGVRRTERSPAKRRRAGTRRPSRSPSVEIVYERRPADTRSHADQWRKKRKRHKRRRREPRSPAVITIDSDSDRGDGVSGRLTSCPGPVELRPDQAEGAERGEGRDVASPTALSDPGVAVATGSHFSVPSLDSLLDLYSPRTSCELPADSPESTLNLDDCAVDVVDTDVDRDVVKPDVQERDDVERDMVDTDVDCGVVSRDVVKPDVQDPDVVDGSSSGTTGNMHQDATMATEAPPSDTRLLESILQELEDILPETRPALDSAADQQEGGVVPHTDQSEAGTETFQTDHTKAVCDSERGGKTSPAI